MNSPLSSALNKLKNPPKNLHLYGLRGSSKSLLISHIKQSNDFPIIVVTSSLEKSEQLRDNLSFFMGDDQIHLFPHWDTLPYDNFSPHRDIVAERFVCLNALITGQAKVVITTPAALMQRIMPDVVFKENCFSLHCGNQYPRSSLFNQFDEAGYVQVDTVEEHGEYSTHEDIIDLFPLNMEIPIRLEWNHNALISMKSFDVQTQLSEGDKIETINVLPGKEVLLSPNTIKLARKKLEKMITSGEPPDRRTAVKSHPLYRQTDNLLQQGAYFAGIESLLGLFYETPSSLFDYLPDSYLFFLDEPNQIIEKARFIYDEIFAEYELSQQQGNLAISPEQLYFSHKDIDITFKNSVAISSFEAGQTEIGLNNSYDCPFLDNRALRLNRKKAHQDPHSSVAHVIKTIKNWQEDGAFIVFTAKNQTHADHFKELLSDFDIFANFSNLEQFGANHWANWLTKGWKAPQSNTEINPILVGSLAYGFHVVDDQGKVRFAILTEEEIFGEKTKNRRLKQNKIQQFMGTLDDLEEGDYVVHIDYGIGQYQGLNKLSVGGQNTDFMILTYARDEKLYVPVDKFHLVQKYVSADGGRPKLNKLGEKSWKRVKGKVAKAVEDISEELVEIYAAREAQKVFKYSPDNHLMTEFELAFPFEETEDQLTVIQEVKEDMESAKPMDRLVCGDVGFGKTEIAIRAAFKAVNDSRQVCVLVPTTILAQQHLVSFRRRMDGMPVTIDVISRFRTASEQRDTIKRLATGEIDILIGTHRILSKDVKFKDLGLLVVDEEQRFGVRHKEKIKRFRAVVDILTLSATPIPRTLHMSLIGIRDLSLISSPPPDRLAVRTRFLKSNDHIIQEAVSREIRRNGQVFIVHNRVETIYEYASYLRQILPKARIAIGHGQMGEHELEKIMIDFIKGEYDVIVSTTIIESGLDIPRANTIIVNNAHQFGLSQLYQLRGRVGRSNLQAYAYLLVPVDKILTNIAEERLIILQELNDLGAGFKIASRDLELRGAGNLLGADQSGHIASVGMELYTQMIDTAVKKLQQKQKDGLPLDEIKISIDVDMSISETYIPSSNKRLSLYKKLAAIESEDELWKLRDGTENRFGHLPDSVVNLFKSIQARLLGQQLGFKAIKHRGQKLHIQMGHTEKLNTNKLVEWLQSSQNSLQFISDDTLVLNNIPSSMNEILEGLRAFEKLFVVPEDVKNAS